MQSSPSSVSDLNSVKNIISEKLQSGGVEQVHVTDVMSTFKKLNPNKSEGIRGCNSSHIKFASKTFIIYFSLLYHCMLYHGYTADDLLCSCIISIPKDKSGSLNDSSNYRGIALCNALCKAIDLWALSRLETNLITSNLQFAFKPKHSTLMCTTVLKEVISHYRNKGSNVYICQIDASKAFDRINLYRLFSILISRNVPASILSPSLFCFNIDILLKRLENSKVGCRIGTQFYGCLAYPDDLTLISPSVKGLQALIDTCEIFGEEYDLVFNSSKTVCIHFGSCVDPIVNMAGVQLKWETKVKHLGNYISKDFSDMSDIEYKRGCFYQYVIKVLALFGKLPSYTVDTLFMTYCTSFYGSVLWNFNSKYIKNIYIAWQKSIRRIWKIPYRTHTRLLPFISACNLHVSAQLLLRFVKLYLSMFNSNNNQISSIARRTLYNVNTTLAENRIYVNLVFSIDMSKCNYIEAKNEITCAFIAANITNAIEGSIIRDLCNTRDGCSYIEYFIRDDVNTLIEDICRY